MHTREETRSVSTARAEAQIGGLKIVRTAYFTWKKKRLTVEIFLRLLGSLSTDIVGRLPATSMSILPIHSNNEGQIYLLHDSDLGHRVIETLLRLRVLGFLE